MPENAHGVFTFNIISVSLMKEERLKEQKETCQGQTGIFP
jgi:hypothetical protein